MQKTGYMGTEEPGGLSLLKKSVQVSRPCRRREHSRDSLEAVAGDRPSTANCQGVEKKRSL